LLEKKVYLYYIAGLEADETFARSIKQHDLHVWIYCNSHDWWRDGWDCMQRIS